MTHGIPDLGAELADAVSSAIEPDRHDVKHGSLNLPEIDEPQKAYHDPLWDVMDPPEKTFSLDLPQPGDPDY